MDFNKLEELKNDTLLQLDDFYNEFRNENPDESSFENWNARDILGHLTWWLRFAGTKIEYIKNNQNHGSVTNLKEFNKSIFNSYKNISITIIYGELGLAMDHFMKMSKLYTIEELSGKNFPTGFKFELWRYMDLHLFIHHIMHILFYYLKKGNMESFFKIITRKEADIFEYGNINIFLYKDYFEDKTLMKQQFNKLKQYNEKYKNKLTEEIIRINME